MNIRSLHQSVTQSFDQIRPGVDSVFAATLSKIDRRGRAVNIKSFTERLNVVLRPFAIRITTEVNNSFGNPQENGGKYYPAIGGFCFEPSSPLKQARINVVLCVHSVTNRLDLPIDSWHYFQFRLLKVINHELVHRAQYQSGRKRTNSLIFRPQVSASMDMHIYNEQRYLGDIDEIEAYARDCVEEWNYLQFDMPLTMASLKRQFRQQHSILPSIEYYQDVFKHDETHPSVRRFFRKVMEWNKLVTPLASSLPIRPVYLLSRKPSSAL